MRASARASLVLLGLLACACDREPPPPVFTAPPGHEPPPFERAVPVGPWYTITLPETAVRVPVPTDEIESVHVLEPVDGAELTIVRPMPGQSDLADWTASVGAIFSDHPAERMETAQLDGAPAQLAVCAGALRWTLVADGFGVILQCTSPTPHDEAWLHARCDPAVQTFRLVHPIHD